MSKQLNPSEFQKLQNLLQKLSDKQIAKTITPDELSVLEKSNAIMDAHNEAVKASLAAASAGENGPDEKIKTTSEDTTKSDVAATAKNSDLKAAIATAAAKEFTEVRFKPKKEELHLVHVELTKGARFDPETGKEIGVPYMQSFTVKDFKQFEDYAESLGYKYEVKYKP